MDITPVLLAGGSGTRLWPLSRQSYPKQFSRLIGSETLFQASARRLSGQSEGLSFTAPLTMTNSDFRFIVTEQLSEIGLDPGAILIEPFGRNTAPAILAAALYLMQSAPDAVMLVAPSDHVIADTAAFHRAVAQGVGAITRGDLVTFGITPDRAETGYGYLALADTAGADGATRRLERFIEKPDATAAAEMLAAGNFLWNSGIFLFRAKDIVAAFREYAPGLMPPVAAAVETAKTDLGFVRLAAAAWAEAEDISIDYAVMERATNLSVVPYAGSWSDLGGWDAVWRESEGDAQAVVTSGNASAIDCRNSLLRSESEGQHIIGIGLDNIIAVAMADAVLVADMSRSQDVKQAVALLKEQGASQALSFPKDHRPWGWFETLVIGERFHVKRIVVHPAGALSLQSHFHRSEHWIIVKGTARVTVDDSVRLVTENESVYIPLGAKHRLENPGKVAMVLIEVQTGVYVGEDDIVRYEDVYARE